VSQAIWRDLAAGRYGVEGSLTFATVREVLRESQAALAASGELEIDLSGVVAADSAGLALLIEWYRDATRRNRDIRIRGTPASLLALAKISDLDKVLPLQ
jgi:phospholipid transport system transporter-binding protein